MSSVVAIHQPNFFPWMGFFDKIAVADIFILLDHVQFPKTGGTYTNRVMMLVNGEARWVSAPVVRNYHGVRSIIEMEYSVAEDWRTRVLKTMQANYAKAPRFHEVMPVLEKLVACADNSVAGYNIAAIYELVRQLGIDDSKIVRSSTLDCSGQSNEMLISLTRKVGGGIYMCGGGADAYQEESLFAEAGIELRHQNFKSLVYAQTGTADFVPGLSIIDAAMNLGWAGTAKLLGDRT